MLLPLRRSPASRVVLCRFTNSFDVSLIKLFSIENYEPLTISFVILSLLRFAICNILIKLSNKGRQGSVVRTIDRIGKDFNQKSASPAESCAYKYNERHLTIALLRDEISYIVERTIDEGRDPIIAVDLRFC